MIDRRNKVLQTLGKTDCQERGKSRIVLTLESKLGIQNTAADCPQLDRMVFADSTGIAWKVNFINYTPFSCDSLPELIRPLRNI